MRTADPTDLSNAEWSYLEPYLPAPKTLGRPKIHHTRKVLDAIFYILKSGCAWRLLPRDLERPGRPFTTTTSENLVHRRHLGEAAYRATRASARTYRAKHRAERGHIVDSQSVKTTGVGGERGYDSGKKVKGRKRHLFVDTQGLVLKVKVQLANVMDRDGVKPLLERVREHFRRLSHLWLDAGYNGKGKGKDWAEKALGLTAEVVRRPRRPRYVWVKEGEEIDWERIRKLLPEPGFKVLPRRWVVERTFSWIDQNRRMSKDYERLPDSSEAFIYLAMTRLMVRRLARS